MQGKKLVTGGKTTFCKKINFRFHKGNGKYRFFEKSKKLPKIEQGGQFGCREKTCFSICFLAKKFVGAKFGITRVFMKNKKLIFVIQPINTTKYEFVKNTEIRIYDEKNRNSFFFFFFTKIFKGAKFTITRVLKKSKNRIFSFTPSIQQNTNL